MRTPGDRLRKRVFHVLVMFSVVLFILTSRLTWIQLVLGESLSDEALQVRTRSIAIQPRRGVIYDYSGRELAVSIQVDSLYAVPTEIPDAWVTAEALSPLLNRPSDTLYQRLSQPTSFVWIERKMSEDLSARIQALELPGIYMTKESKRYYPKGQLAAHVIGFAGVDSQGLEGIEYAYDSVLRGEDGRIVMEYDALDREIPQTIYSHIPAVPGDNLYLGIDEFIQYVAERELARAVEEFGAQSGLILVMEPSTGRLVALANHPSFDLNQWSSVSSELWRNPIISDTLHPGSIFKPVTAAAALEEGRVTPSTAFYDPGFVRVPGAIIQNFDKRGLLATDFRMAFARSANTIFVEVGLDLGMSAFYRYLEGFGFLSPTGVELPGETSAIFPPQHSARPVDLAVMSFGQTLTVTPIQMMTAMSALINGGYLMKPMVVSGIEKAHTGSVTEVQPEVIRRIISETTSSTIRDLMYFTVEEGTGGQARVPGYKVGGKTGTAQKTIDGQVAKEAYMSAFMGFAPVDQPALLCYVVIDEPQGVHYGSLVAAPVVQKVLEESLRYLEIPPDFPDQVRLPEVEEVGLSEHADVESEEASVSMPDLHGINRSEALESLESLGLKGHAVSEFGVVGEQWPAPGVSLRRGSHVVLYPEPSVEASMMTANEVVMPRLYGETLRQAAATLSDLGLRLETTGAGVVKEQDPLPGARLSPGSIIRLHLEAPGP